MPGLLIAIVGAESTGKSSLAQALQVALSMATGLRCALAPEVLREWCEAAGRTPRPEEQAGIAEAQAARCEALALTADLVLCDTTSLMTAVYSELLFADRSLLGSGLAFHRRCALTLLTALDLPWVADGLQRDGAHVRAPVDAAVRRALMSAGLGWSVVAGSGERRVDAALNAITPLLLARRTAPLPATGLFSRLQARQDALPEWRWACDNCDVPECEHLSLRR
ncbi:AAA family ATPase [Roseateles sp.]|uniref:AAA family ATPase n=1 Tax=Roseateles sp. TaxID=1971397 RepID=UPI003D0F9465